MLFSQERLSAGKRPKPALLIPLSLIALVIAMLVVAHWQYKARIGPPPAAQFFDDLPIAGSLVDARRKGFDYCIDFNTSMRCRRSDVMLLGRGPFSAAVDLAGGDGRGGFRQLILWHDQDPRIASDFARALEQEGWHSCLTMLHNWGDQNILTRPGSPVRISVDLSYYSKRRIRVIPGKQIPPPKCE